MTNKQIIIDGVNVAECRYFISEGDFNNCGHICKGTECKYKRLWYKKQLKRKEQECEQEKTLKEMYFTYYKAKHSDIDGKFFRYKRVLTEIKYIAEENIRIADLEGLDGVYRRGLAEQILQKISEVENDRQD